MDFAKKYPLTQQPDEYVLVQWTRGYQQVEVYYQNELIGTVDGVVNLKKGVRIVHPKLGNIDLKMSEKPLVINVVIDGYHSPVNCLHPVKELISLSPFFWMLLAFSFIAGSVEVGLFYDYMPYLMVAAPMNISILLLYFVGLLGIRKGKPWAYYMVVGVFSLCTLVSLIVMLEGLMGGVLLYVFETIRFAALTLFIYHLKTVNAARRHLRFGTIHSRITDDLLDVQV